MEVFFEGIQGLVHFGHGWGNKLCLVQGASGPPDPVLAPPKLPGSGPVAPQPFHQDAVQLPDAGARAKRLQDLQREWRERLVKVRGSALLLRLIDSLFVSPVLTIPQVQHLLGITYRSAKANVEKLVQVEILKRSGESSYGKTYFAPEIIEAII
jgi:hypothetical protein